MKLIGNRRNFLLATAAIISAPVALASSATRPPTLSAKNKIEKIERDFDGRLGVSVRDTATGRQLGHRADERFPFCSTFKVIAASAILTKSVQVPGLMERVIRFRQSDLVTYSPVTEKHVDTGMTVADLCAAGIQYSDNTAANLMIKLIGGPAAVSAYARTIGDTAFRLDRWETALNTAIPGDLRDTSTPFAMCQSLNRLLLGDAMSFAHREQLRSWLSGNTTGAQRIKAGIPGDWLIGDKTGSGDYGTANDLAVLWPPKRAPVIVAIYTTQHAKEIASRSDIIASATRVVVEWLGER
ncbi:class A beta-lactamase [Glaciimonas immobilis]|uniref:beta-lactamase n=1 Tax=Glaciimonas immobilis TaxID=728004 RepID=A0A840RXG2_9BURK|nr:class A beta-lactamase [Glaciimonas immobilis]KAF3998276.1 class A beta-lactamase [Glaciimonas immobilis]MBB5201892.1 beta-lactamase class A [Glaciimonas immobilis]